MKVSTIVAIGILLAVGRVASLRSSEDSSALLPELPVQTDSLIPSKRQFSAQIDSYKTGVSSVSSTSAEKAQFEPNKFAGHNSGHSSFSSSSSNDYGSLAEGTGNFHSLYPVSGSVSSGAHLSPSGPTAASASQSPSYAYYYQHYPTSSSGNVGWSSGTAMEGYDDGHFGGDGGGAGIAGLGGLGGIKALGVLAAAAKGILAIKPFVIIGLLLLIAIPILLLFLPIPIVTVSGYGKTGKNTYTRLRQNHSSPLLSYITSLSAKVLGSEECLERLLCKLPPPPDKYGKKASSLWKRFGVPLFAKHERLSRGLNAYFQNSAAKNRHFKCDQKFRCSKKFI